MTSAEFESQEVLLFLVSYLKELTECGEKDPKQCTQMNEILHQKSCELKQNLMAMIMNNDSLGLSQQIMVELEAWIHQWNEAEFQGWITFVFVITNAIVSFSNSPISIHKSLFNKEQPKGWPK